MRLEDKLSTFKIIESKIQGYHQYSSISEESNHARDSLVNRTIFEDGRTICERYATLIQLAKKQILIQTNVWQLNSEVSNIIFQALMDLNLKLKTANQDQVEVYILINKLTFIAALAMRISSPSSSSKRNEVKPISSFEELKKTCTHLKIRAQHHEACLGALHSKTLVIDKLYGMVSTGNFQRYNSGTDCRHDIALEFKGGIVANIREDFIHCWQQLSQILIEDFDDEEKIDQYDDKHSLADYEKCEVLALSRLSNGSPFKKSLKNTQNRALVAAIIAAKKSIHIQTPNLNAPIIIDAIVKAIKNSNANFSVKILLGKNFNNKRQLRHGSNSKSVTKLLKKLGIHANRLDVRWYCDEDQKIIDGDEGPVNHIKYMSIDNEIILVGSANLDVQSISRSREFSVAIHKPNLVNGWDKRIFMPKFNRSVPTKMNEVQTCCRSRYSLFDCPIIPNVIDMPLQENYQTNPTAQA